MEPRSQSLRISDGGRLITVASPENVGPANYTEKVNWRRVDDKEVRREGNVAFGNSLAGILGLWEGVRPNGQRALVAATTTKIYKYDAGDGSWDEIGTGFTATQWQGESSDGYLVLNNGYDLMVYYRVEDSAVTPFKEMREVGIAAVGTFEVHNGFLLLADILEIKAASLAAVLNSGTPFGPVNPALCNRIQFRVWWSDYDEITNFSPVVTGTIQSSTKNKITLPFPVSAFGMGVRLAIIGAGPGGGVLGGDVDNPDGIEVTGVTGAEITLAVSANASLTYPLTVSVTRFADTSTFSGYSDIQDDGAKILRMKRLKKVVVVYRETGIWVGRYSGIVESPFIFTPEYAGENVPSFPLAVANVLGDYHVFATKRNFYRFDGAGNPVIHQTLDNARTLFFANTGTYPFAAHNPITEEIWFCGGAGTLAYDYKQDTASWINEVYKAAVFAYDPVGSGQRFFLHATAAAVFKYGLVFEGTAPLTYLRASGTTPTPTLTFGLGSYPHRAVSPPASDFSEVDLHGYLLLPAGGSANVKLTVTLWGKDNVAASDELLFTTDVETPVTEPLIEAFFRNIYFKDRIQITDSRDIGFALVGRGWAFTSVNSRGVTRGVNGN